jgi:uncharacterized RDD family membrane protein YckC
MQPILASRTKRLMAAILNPLIIYILLLIIYQTFQLIGVNKEYTETICVTIFFLYLFFNYYLMYKFSQTLGKYLLKIQVFDIKKNKRIGF